MRLTIVAMAAALILGANLAGAAHAATYSVTTSHADGGVSVLLFDPGFDTSLGTLEAVSITLNGNLTVTYSLINPFPQGSGLSTFYQQAPGPFAPSIPYVPLGTSQFDAANRSVLPIDLTITPLPSLADYTNPNGNYPDFRAEYEATHLYEFIDLIGTSNLVLTAFDFASAPEVPPVVFGLDPSYFFVGTLTETFTYDPIPEPASLLIVGIGLLGTMEARRKLITA